MSVQQELRINLPEIFYPVITTDKRYICLDGGRGSGKSWYIAYWLLLKSLEKKVRILCTREIQNTIKDSVHRLLSDRINAIKLDNVFDIKVDSIVCKRTGSEFIFKGLLRNPQDIKSTEGLNYAWVEEAQSVSRRSLETLIPTIREPNSQIIFTYNPTNDTDPVHVDFNLNRRDDCLNITANWYDNPWFPDVLRAEMEYDRAHDMDKYLHIWEGHTVRHSDAQVFSGKWFVEEFEAPPGAFFYFGADWGFSKDPTVLLRCYVSDNILYIDHEFYGIGVELDEISIAFSGVPESNRYPIVADSARPDTISHVRGRGFPLIEESKKGKGSVEDGIEHIKKYHKIVIHPRCKNAIYEFKTYSYQVDRLTGAISKKLEEKNNHCIDSLRYALEKARGFKFVAVGPDGAR